MNSHEPVHLQDRTVKARFSIQGARRKLSITLLIVVIVVVMTAWFGFLGWGMIELLHSLESFVKTLV